MQKFYFRIHYPNICNFNKTLLIKQSDQSQLLHVNALVKEINNDQDSDIVLLKQRGEIPLSCFFGLIHPLIGSDILCIPRNFGAASIIKTLIFQDMFNSVLIDCFYCDSQTAQAYSDLVKYVCLFPFRMTSPTISFWLANALLARPPCCVECNDIIEEGCKDGAFSNCSMPNGNAL